MSREHIKEAILRQSLRTREQNARLISPKGTLQNWLIDLRCIFLERETLARIADAFWGRYQNHERFQVGGMETAAIPLLTAILLRAPEPHRDINAFIIRKDRKTTGLGNAIEGSVTADPVVLIDDVVNSGSSAEKARVVVEAAGHTVRELFAVIDYRSKKGLHWRELKGIAVNALFTLQELGLNLQSNPPPLPQRYQPLWQTEVAGGYPYYVVPKSTPLLVDNRLYRGCDAGLMQAFDADSGNLVWEYRTTGATMRKGIWSSPALHQGRLYFGAYNGNIYCLDAQHGTEIWTQAYGEWVGASPIVVPRHGLVYFGIEYERPWAQGGIGAYDLDTGEKAWEYMTRKFQHGSPAYWEAGDLIIWGTADHEMVGMDAKTGAPSWVFATRRSVKYAAAIEQKRGLVAFASFDKSIYLLDAATGRKLGEWETGDICYTTPLFVGNRIFCGSGDRHLYVIDIDRLEVIKKLDLRARVYSSPRLIDGRVMVGTSGGRVVELDPDSLEVQGELQVPDAVTNAITATPDGSRIFISTYMNHFYAFERSTHIGREQRSGLSGSPAIGIHVETTPLS